MLKLYLNMNSSSLTESIGEAFPLSCHTRFQCRDNHIHHDTDLEIAAISKPLFPWWFVKKSSERVEPESTDSRNSVTTIGPLILRQMIGLQILPLATTDVAISSLLTILKEKAVLRSHFANR